MVIELGLRLHEAVQQAAKQLSGHVMRHGGAQVLVQDVIRSAAAWLPAAGVTSLQQQLAGAAASPAAPSAAPLAAGAAAAFGSPLTGERLDAAFQTLRLLNQRLIALSIMAHEPQSSSSSPGCSVSAEAWLVAHKGVLARSHQRHHWQYGFELTLTNTSEEPLQLLRKAWAVQEMNGLQRYRESEGLMGVRPIIQPASQLRCRTAITLDSIKGSMHGHLELRGLESGRTLLAHVRALALTPTAAQLGDPQVTCCCLG